MIMTIHCVIWEGCLGVFEITYIQKLMNVDRHVCGFCENIYEIPYILKFLFYLLKLYKIIIKII